MSDETHPGEVDDYIPVVVTLDEEPADDEMGLLQRGEGVAAVRLVPVDVLRESIGRTVSALGQALSAVGEQAGPLRLSEVQLGFEVSASGQVALVGTAGVKSAITLVFSGPGKKDAR